MKREQAETYDRQDKLNHAKNYFNKSNPLYFCGHSLGLISKASEAALLTVMKQWENQAVLGWHDAHWLEMPMRVGSKIAKLIGAQADEVIATDSTSINLFKLLSAAVQLRAGRHVILTEQNNFSADLYMAEAIAKLHPGLQVKYCAREDILNHIDDHTAVVMVTHVDYRTSQLFDLSKLVQQAHEQGALVLCDLAHSAGVVPLALSQCGIDFAVGCGYKYLNGGPGAPAFLYVAKQHQENIFPILPGWMGHASPFSFSSYYEAAPGIKRFLCGTPSIVAMKSLESSVDLLLQFNMQMMREKSKNLSNYFIKLIRENKLPLTLISPENAEIRGSHLAFSHPDAENLSKALIDAGVVIDFRQPNIIRFGFSPLYNTFMDVFLMCRILQEMMT